MTHKSLQRYFLLKIKLERFCFCNTGWAHYMWCPNFFCLLDSCLIKEGVRASFRHNVCYFVLVPNPEISRIHRTCFYIFYTFRTGYISFQSSSQLRKHFQNSQLLWSKQMQIFDGKLLWTHTVHELLFIVFWPCLTKCEFHTCEITKRIF